jgi:MFS family permease
MLVFGVLGGLGTSLIFTPAIAVVGHWFYVHRGAATGFAATGGSVGGVVFPLLLDSLIPRIGFTWSVRVMAGVSLFLLTIANLFIRSRLPPKPSVSPLPNFRIFADPIFALTSVGVYMVEWGIFVPLAYLPSYALAHGIPSSIALKLLAIFNAASFFGRGGPGFVADRVGRFNMMILMIGVCLGSTMGIWYFAGSSVRAVVAYAIVFGFASGSNITLTPVCVGQLCETEAYGRYYAATYTLVSFG